MVTTRAGGAYPSRDPSGVYPSRIELCACLACGCCDAVSARGEVCRPCLDGRHAPRPTRGRGFGLATVLRRAARVLGRGERDA